MAKILSARYFGHGNTSNYGEPQTFLIFKYKVLI